MIKMYNIKVFRVFYSIHSSSVQICSYVHSNPVLRDMCIVYNHPFKD